MRFKTVFTGAVCVLLVAFMLAGCGMSSYDPKAQVQGNLDAQYLNKYSEDYLKAIVNTKEELEQVYEDGLEIEADYFINYFDIIIDQCPEGTKDRIKELYRDIYAKSKYEVGDAARSGDMYLVSVTIYPIDIFQKISDEDAEAFMDAWQNDDTLVNMTDAELEAEWADRVIKMCEARVGSIGYLEPETISVQIVKDDEGYYIISDNDFQRIDELIIQY